MKVYELLELAKPTFDKINKYNVSVQDVQHLDLFKDYQKMVSSGDKITYIMAHLGDIYNLKPRRIRYIVKSLSKEI